MTAKGMPAGMRMPSASEERAEGESPQDFLSALDSAPEEMAEGEPDGMELDADQLSLAEQMGLDKDEAIALRRFIESVL